MAVLYTNCYGGYHSDLRATWRSLERAVETVAPQIRWKRLDRLTVLFDDQVNYPAECCRASLGFVVAAGADVHEAVSRWQLAPLVSCHGLKIAVCPAGDCLVADMPQCGPLSYMLCLVRALHCLRHEVRTTGVAAKVPGLLELHSPAHRRITYLLPLEQRTELLPF